MVAAETETIVLFADIVDSTSLYAQDDVESARRVLMACIELMSSVVEAAGGRVVDRVGDEILCVFDRPDLAAQTAASLQQRVRDAHGDGLLPRPMEIRVGLEHGPIIETDEGVFGATVHAAARLVSLAKAGQTLTTKETLERLNPIDRRLARYFDRLVLKGQPQEREIHELLWDTSATLVVGSAEPRRRVRESEGVELVSGATVYRVDASTPRLEVGRRAACALRVNAPSVSGLHARILWNRNKVVLEDVSTNGTWLERKGADPILIHHDSASLSGAGRFWLGAQDPAESVSVIHFRCLGRQR